MRRILPVAALLGLLVVVFTAGSTAQSRPTLTPADYDQFESLTAGAARGGLSPDGRWLAYGLNRVGGRNELRLTRVGTVAPVHVVPFGSQAVFNADSTWLAYGIGYSEDEQEKMRTARTPIHRKLGLYHLESGTETILDGIETFAFDRTGASLAMKRYATAAPLGATLIVRDLATGTDTTFGNVGEYAWQAADSGRLLAMTISADGQAGNGIHLYNATTTRLRVLHAGAADYSSLVWRTDSADLVALRSKVADGRDGPTQVAMAWLSVGQPNETVRTLDPLGSGADDLSARRLVTFRRPSWHQGGPDAGPIVVLGVTEWPAKPETPTGGRGSAAEQPDLDIWHWNDHIVKPAQKVRASADQRRNLPAVWHLMPNRLTIVGRSFDETVNPIPGTTQALVSEFTPYLMQRSIGRPAADLLLADLSTGARRPLRTRVTSTASVSPGGRYVLFSEGGHWWTIDLTTDVVTNITRTVRTSFIDTASDSTAPEKPMFGTAGWTAGDAEVVLYDRLGLWTVSPDGRRAVDVIPHTDQVRYRYLRLDAPAAGSAPDPVVLHPAYFSIVDLQTKRSGYARTTGGQEARMVWLDKMVSGLARAEKADVFVYTAQAADDSPDLFTAGPDLRPATQNTETNPFLSQYAWTRAELLTYDVQWRGQPRTTLQGILHYPANYEPGRTYPMVVYLYEKLSDNLHRFQNPSERDYYNGTALTQNGYFFFQPDIIFQPGEPGVSVVESVTAGVRAVTSKGIVDASKIGVMGHSWGGFDAMYLATHSRLFAAAVSGAGISNLISNYGSHHFSSGIAETDHIETGQQRMVVPLYEDLQRYIRNSAVFGISTMTTPMLLMTGDSDGTVYWHQSVEFYNIARRAGRNVVMLVYNGEDHSLRTKKNQIDYHRRIRHWFDHYLKGVPAERWITG